MELIDTVWRDVPDFREFYVVADGLFRTQVPAFDERVIRELLINALVHRPYTQRGDIHLNLHPERLEIVNPGPLPPGVTPENVLHASVRRNDHLARLCHDLKLMEREGSGFDAIYNVLLSQGWRAPLVAEGPDWVRVTLARTAPDRQVDKHLRLIDFDDPKQNSYLAVRELWVRGKLWLRRPDVIGFVNGLRRPSACRRALCPTPSTPKSLSSSGVAPATMIAINPTR